METDLLAEFLNRIYPLASGTENYIRDIAYRVQYTKGQILASPGKRADEIWYMVNGLAKEYYYEASGKCIITSFWKENELMVIPESFFRKIPSDRYIELVEDSVLLGLSGRQVLRLQLAHPEVHSLGYGILSLAKRKSDEKGSLLFHSAKERYSLFCEKFPWERISVADAASYLGLTRETLSSVRGKM